MNRGGLIGTLGPLLFCVACAGADGGGLDDTDATSSATDDLGSTGEGGSTGPMPEPLPPLDAAPLTTDHTLVPVHEIVAEPYLDPRIPADMDQMLDEGWGVEMEGPAEPVVDLTADGSMAPAAGPAAALLSRFMHLADTQLADDESPTRAAIVDTPVIAGGFRPQEAYHCHILNAAVRTINAIHQSLAIDFVMLGGDNADSAQGNELRWLMRILDGGIAVHCDSGDDDDPVPGPGNDPKDPLTSNGLAMPWKWVTGNHDILVQGNFSVASQAALAVGDEASGGTRDWSMPGGPVVTGTVIPDDRRDLLNRAEILALIMAEGDGHGIEQETVEFGKAYYAFDVGDALRMIVVDSAAETGAAGGVIHASDADVWLRPVLDQAEADGRWVLVASHHAAGSLGDGSGLGGLAQPDALEPADWEILLGEYPNVVAHLAGHAHVHGVRLVEPTGGSPYWEVRTAALGDWPHQMRLVEIRDEDNGFLTLTSIAVDYSVDGDALSAQGRRRGVTDLTTGWQVPGNGKLEDRNVRLWWPKP